MPRRVLLLVLAVALLAATAAPGALGAPPASAADLRLLSEQRLSARMEDLTFSTPALAAPTKVRVLLPSGYDDAPDTRYPVLYLLHGGAADYRSWTEQGGTADQLTAGLPLIVVMPDAGRSAWYTDWYNNGAGGTPMWETYHVRQLIPWIDAHLRTIGSRQGRAIAGLSSGGFGAMSYASRHPDLFVAAAAFSGAVDTNTPPVVAGKVIDALAAQDGGIPGSLFGLRETEEVRWRGHNPWDLASNLRDMSITLRTGNGQAGGPYGGGGPTDPGGAFLETSCHDESVSFNHRLDELGIAHVWDDYGPGTHSFSYWNRSLKETLPLFMQVFAEHRPDPAQFSYRAIEPRYDIYGWSVDLDRRALEFSSIDNASSAGFGLTGSGTAHVRTAPLFEPGRAYDVTMRGQSGASPTVAVADSAGRLALTVPLGPGNLTQQHFTPTGASPGTKTYTTAVSITAQPTTGQ